MTRTTTGRFCPPRSCRRPVAVALSDTMTRSNYVTSAPTQFSLRTTSLLLSWRPTKSSQQSRKTTRSAIMTPCSSLMSSMPTMERLGRARVATSGSFMSPRVFSCGLTLVCCRIGLSDRTRSTGTRTRWTAQPLGLLMRSLKMAVSHGGKELARLTFRW